MYVIRLLKDIAANKRLGPDFGVWAPENPRWPGYYEEYWMNQKERFYLGIFIVQILNLIAAFFLLFASAALIYGVHSNSKHLVWPWFPCMVCSIACSAAYCILWWAGNVESYWLVLTIVEFLAILVNLYCLLCVIVQYRRIIKGYVQQTYDDDYKPKQLVYEYRPREEVTPKAKVYDSDYSLEKKKVDGYANATYEPDLSAANKVYLYKGGAPAAVDHQTQTPDFQRHQQPEPKWNAPYQPYPYQMQQQFRYLPQAEELPVKSMPAPQPSPEPEFKTRFTEAWIKGVNNAHPEEPKAPIVSAHSSPERTFKRTKSVDAIHDRGSKRRHRMRSAKSKDSVSSRSYRRRDRSSSSSSTQTTSDEEESEETETATQRSYRSRHRDTESDTGYSASVVNSERSGHRRSHRHQRSERHHDRDKRRHRRPRDVKREDKERYSTKGATAETPQGPALTPEKVTAPSHRPPVGGVPVLPTYTGAPGGISIPQHIVIPPQPKGAAAGQPQRFHINSEITIKYNNDKDKQRAGGEPERRSAASNVQQISTTTTAPITAPSPQSTASTAPIGGIRVTNIDSSGGGDSKGYSSTAV